MVAEARKEKEQATKEAPPLFEPSDSDEQEPVEPSAVFTMAGPSTGKEGVHQGKRKADTVRFPLDPSA